MKKFVKNTLKGFGFKIQRTQPWDDNYKWLKKYKIKTVIDVGANTGQFAKEMIQHLPNVAVHSFEPIPDVYKTLVANTSHLNVTTYKYGLGNEKTKLEINLNEFSPSSSFLDLGREHKTNFTKAVKTKKVMVNVERLDDILENVSLEKSILTKIDVQGFEDKVILGGQNILKTSKVVFLEVSFIEMYKDQKLFNDMYSMMQDLGFQFHGNLNQFHRKEDGKLMFGDAIFIRP